ncbi:MAG: PHP domain-containing protein, partial [Verrucomicrobia bacterium]
MNTLVAHLDADAFFASVEQAADVRLRGRPVAVGGEKRGIIASASYEARRYGIYTPMPTALARRLCPKLIILPGDFEKYELFSRWMFSYAYDFTPEVEIGSIDEGWFSLAGVRRPPVEVAATIREAIRQSLKITVSEGLGRNKLVSQIASKLNKPGAFRLVPPGEEQRFLAPLPNRWLPGVGPHTAARLDAAGLPLIRHIAALPVDLLSLLVGGMAPQLSRFARGEDDRPLVPDREPAKSYSQQRTFERDQTDEAYLEATLRRMADELFARVRADARTVRTLTVRIRYNDMTEDQVSESLPEPTDLETDVYGRLAWMLKRAWRRRVSLRMLSLKLSNLYGAVFRSELPLTPEAENREARHRLAEVVDRLREEHGRSIVLRGHDLLLRRGEPDPTPRLQVNVPSVPWKSRSEGGRGIGRPIRPLPRTEPPAAPPPRAPSTPPRPAAVRSRLQPPVPLVVRSHYSFLNSTLSIEEIVRLAAEQELPAVALCDQGNLHGAVEFFLRAREAGLRPVLGAELRCGDQPLWLYVEDATGYENLCHLLSPPAPRSRGRLDPGAPLPETTQPPPGRPVEVPEAALRDPLRT